jgi:predicted RNA binding protein YcfA (HicA-like mRNA interferase family)
MPKIPGVNHRDAVRALQKAGFRVVRESKHIIMSDGVRILTIPTGILLMLLRSAESLRMLA